MFTVSNEYSKVFSTLYLLCKSLTSGETTVHKSPLSQRTEYEHRFEKVSITVTVIFLLFCK